MLKVDKHFSIANLIKPLVIGVSILSLQSPLLAGGPDKDKEEEDQSPRQTRVAASQDSPINMQGRFAHMGKGLLGYFMRQHLLEKHFYNEFSAFASTSKQFKLAGDDVLQRLQEENGVINRLEDRIHAFEVEAGKMPKCAKHKKRRTEMSLLVEDVKPLIMDAKQVLGEAKGNTNYRYIFRAHLMHQFLGLPADQEPTPVPCNAAFGPKERDIKYLIMGQHNNLLDTNTEKTKGHHYVRSLGRLQPRQQTDAIEIALSLAPDWPKSVRCALTSTPLFDRCCKLSASGINPDVWDLAVRAFAKLSDMEISDTVGVTDISMRMAILNLLQNSKDKKPLNAALDATLQCVQKGNGRLQVMGYLKIFIELLDVNTVTKVLNESKVQFTNEQQYEDRINIIRKVIMNIESSKD